MVFENPSDRGDAQSEDTATRQLYGNLWGMVDGQPLWSDAASVSRLVGLPAWFWATGWLGLSVLLLKLGLEHPL